jgi:hypothetical protein
MNTINMNNMKLDYDAQIFIGCDSRNHVRIHLCDDQNNHAVGYFLFVIDITGYCGDRDIGGIDEIDSYIDTDDSGRLCIIGIDDI